MRLIDADDFRSWLLKQKRLSKGYTLMILDEAPTIDPVKHTQQEAEKNEPLTREELRGMAERCEAVYVANINGTPLFRGKKHCAAILDVKPAFGSSDMHIQAIYGDRLTLWEDDYGRTWIAYGHPPEENRAG